MNRRWKKADGFCLTAVRILGVVFTGYLFFQGLFTVCLLDSAPEHTYFVKNNWMVSLAAVTAAVGLTAAVCRLWGRTAALRREKRAGSLNGAVRALPAAVLLACLVWIFIAPEGLYSDQHELVTAAGQLLQGDFRAWQPGGYAYEWPFQNGMILLLAALGRLLPFWEPAVVFQILNAAAAVGSAVIYGLLLDGRREGGITSAVQKTVLLLYFPFFMYCTFVYGTLLGFFLVLLAVERLSAFERTGRWSALGWACVSMAAAMQIKPNYLLMLIGIVLVLLYESVFERKLRRAAAAALLVISFAAGSLLVKGLVTGITGIPVSGGNPAQAHIAMGLQEGPKAEGWFNWYNRELFMESGFDTKTAREAAGREIRERLGYFKENPDKAVRFFVRKTASEWNNPTFQCFYIHNIKGDGEASGPVKSVVNDGGKVNILLIWLLDIFQSVILFGALSFLILRRPENMRDYLFLIFFIGAFLFYAVWEAKAQYTMVYFYGLLPYGAAGYAVLGGKLRGRSGMPPGSIECAGAQGKRAEQAGLQGIREKRARTAPGRLKQGGRPAVNGGIVWIAVFLAAVLLLAADEGPVSGIFKLNGDTEAYYSYIHEFNDGFGNLRY